MVEVSVGFDVWVRVLDDHLWDEMRFEMRMVLSHSQVLYSLLLQTCEDQLAAREKRTTYCGARMVALTTSTRDRTGGGSRRLVRRRVKGMVLPVWYRRSGRRT